MRLDFGFATEVLVHAAVTRKKPNGFIMSFKDSCRAKGETLIGQGFGENGHASIALAVGAKLAFLP